MVEPSLALWLTLQKMPMKGCHGAVSCTATSLGGMPELHDNCPLSESGSFQTTDVVQKPVPFSRCKEKASPSPSTILSLRNVAIFHRRSFESLSFLRYLFFHWRSFLSP
jgi:hypothetical protein